MDDEFGDFEETTPVTGLDFDRELFQRIVNEGELPSISDENVQVDKMCILESSSGSLKRYNVLTTGDRQYRYDEKQTAMGSTQGQLVKLESIRLVIEVVNKWMDTKLDGETGNQNNIFQWWSGGNEGPETEQVDREVSLGDKLLNSANRSAIKLRTERELKEREELEATIRRNREITDNSITNTEEPEKEVTQGKNKKKKKSGKWNIWKGRSSKSKSNISKDHISSNEVSAREGAEEEEDNAMGVTPRLAFGDALMSNGEIDKEHGGGNGYDSESESADSDTYGEEEYAAIQQSGDSLNLIDI